VNSSNSKTKRDNESSSKLSDCEDAGLALKKKKTIIREL
jgi:hypothetical protein